MSSCVVNNANCVGDTYYSYLSLGAMTACVSKVSRLAMVSIQQQTSACEFLFALRRSLTPNHHLLFRAVPPPGYKHIVSVINVICV